MLRGCVLVLALLSLALWSVEAQRSNPSFREVQPKGNGIWAPRQKANVEFVKKTTTFRDGTRASITNNQVTLTNYFLLYGGQGSQGSLNDVWASQDGATWAWVAGYSADAPDDSYSAHPNNPETFDRRSQVAHCQDSSYRQYVVGGENGNEVFGDVWSSPNGDKWTKVYDGGTFEPVYLANMVGDTNGAIYLAGGILDLSGTPRRSTGAVYVSTNQGRAWRQVTSGFNPTSGLPTGPGERAVSILLSPQTNALIWLTGVNTGYEVTAANDRIESYYKDVWVSTNQGAQWNPINQNTPFGRRDDANAEITEGGLIVLAGGYGGNGQGLERNGEVYNDVWVSPNGGYTWGLCVSEAEWDDRRYQMTLLDGEGYLYVMGGLSGGNPAELLGDIWKSTWTFSDTAATAAKCRVTVPGCGAGLKCMPTSPSTLVAADGSGVYCDTCPYSFSGQSAVQTTVIAFLVVFIVLTVLSVIALIYTYHKLRSAGAPSPIPLPASAQRWWNKDTAGAVGSTDAGASTANGDGLYQPLRIRDQV